MEKIEYIEDLVLEPYTALDLDVERFGDIAKSVVGVIKFNDSLPGTNFIQLNTNQFNQLKSMSTKNGYLAVNGHAINFEDSNEFNPETKAVMFTPKNSSEPITVIGYNIARGIEGSIQDLNVDNLNIHHKM